jgi:uncharacterized repeat protein (TIGR02543 family)
MEYKIGDATEWTDAAKTMYDENGENPKPIYVDTSSGDVEITVRIKVAGDRPLGTAPHGTEVTVVIKEGQPDVTVTYNENGHGKAPSPSTGLTYNALVPEPVAPVAAGYIFGGWYREATCVNAWDFAKDTVTANTTLYAKWTLKDPTVVQSDHYVSVYTGVEHYIYATASHEAGDEVTLTYQWYKNDTKLEGYTTPQILVVDVEHSGDYHCVVTASDDDNQTADAESDKINVNIYKIASTYTPPTGKNLPYTGAAQVLIDAGTTTDGTMVYRLSPDDPWSAELPKGTEVGNYKIYYKVIGDDTHEDTNGLDYVISTIRAAEATLVTAPQPQDSTYDGTPKQLIDPANPGKA